MKTINWIQLLLLLALILMGIYYGVFKKNALNKCSEQTHGVILDKYKQKKRGWYIKYSYEVDGNNFTSTVSLKGEDITSSIGDTVEINYSCANPNLSSYTKLK